MTTQFRNLLAKHLNNTLQENERQLLATLLALPENQLYLASLIDENSLDESLIVAANAEIGAALFRRIQTNIEKNDGHLHQLMVDQPEPKKGFSPLYRQPVFGWIAAASVVLAVIFFSILNNGNDAPAVAVKNNEPSDSAAFTLRHEVNTSGNEKRIELSDGSLIVLANNSDITYRDPFSGRRDIKLNGKAYFTVAKDKTKPFTVTSHELSTTALGTAFMVTAYENTHRIIVRLYEGKVVIKAVSKVNHTMNGDVYLLPGQQFIFHSGTAEKKTFKMRAETPEELLKEEGVTDNPLLPKDVEIPWFMFNNQPLETVLTDLEALYNVKIIFDKKDVRAIYFTSRYNKTVPVETVLKQICRPNHLTLTKKDSVFILTK